MPTPDALTFTFLIVTSGWQAQVPDLSLAECNWMATSAPMVVAEQSRLGGGVPLELKRASCIPEPR